ncbi:MAG: UDPglucose 6-dehydrogenase [Fimbriimonadaceae bacterium]|jgi:UDPglucose 6-dehydrogenase|nr:UDPglucose 6-dehydrogenase [Fimbriimonadaceae bacterium]
MKIVINGTGYVGLTTGSALAYLGHEVTCVDIDEKKIEDLKNGVMPIYEPGLEELIRVANSHLQFSTNAADAIQEADVVFIAVGTPPMPDGKPNLNAVCAAATTVGENLRSEFTVVVNKSTVPIGCASWVESIIREAYEDSHEGSSKGRFAVTSNPEFLREGSAIFDILYPDRVVVGSNDARATEMMYTLYRPILEQRFPAPTFLPRPDSLSAVPLIATDISSAELIKYASNAFLSTKISFINEISELAEKVGADVTQIAKGIGLDSRIGPRFLQAGLGWGGSCFGKDSSALVATAREYGLRMPIVEAAREVNYRQRERIVEKLQNELKIIKGKTIGILGLAFKANTDDLRDAPALDLAQSLVERGNWVRCHDPVALKRAREETPDSGLYYFDDVEHMCQNVDALVLCTEWPQFRDMPWKKIAKTVQNPLFIDGRNFLDADKMRKAGFNYVGMGR